MQIEPISEIEYRVGLINSIGDSHKKLRQASKPCTFALQYQGTFLTLINSAGFSEEEAKEIEHNYHKAYYESKKWLESEIAKATSTGFVVGAFGLKIRTPILQQSIVNGSRALSVVKAEARTAGNAIQQSWCLLNNRAHSEFMEKVRNSPYALRIRPCALIHDALYFLVDNDPEVVLWVNRELIKCMEWNDHPAIYHGDVGLGGELSLFVPNWTNEIKLPNSLNETTLSNIVNHYEESITP